MSDDKKIESGKTEGTQQPQTSRRTVLKSAATGAPMLMMLAHRPTYAAGMCFISGFQSINPSGPPRTPGGCGGFSPGGWKKPDVGQGNSDGNRDQWILAGFYPNPRGDGYLDPITGDPDPAGTPFNHSSAFGSGTSATLHDVLLNSPGPLEFHAIANLLNASYFGDYRLTPSDVVGLYWAAKTGGSFTTSTGVTVSISEADLQVFFDQYH